MNAAAYLTNVGPVRVLYGSPADTLSAAVLERVAQRHGRREIVLSFDPKPIPSRNFDWSATDWNTYDGAPDSGNAHQVGYGRTAEAALAGLLDILEEDEAERVA